MATDGGHGQQHGVTLIELVVVMTIIAVLTAILTPTVINYIEQARNAKAQADTKTIGEAIGRFEQDVGRYPIFTSGGGFPADSSANVVRLEGPGTAPTETSATAWTAASPADSDCTSGCQSGLIADQLLTNAPAYTTTSSLAKPFKWKGPYVDVDTDPWGKKYLVNVINCKSSSSDACFALSAGPDGKVQTAFNISRTSSLAASGDDIIYRIK